MADLVDLPSWKLSTADLIQQVLICFFDGQLLSAVSRVCLLFALDGHSAIWHVAYFMQYSVVTAKFSKHRIA